MDIKDRDKIRAVRDMLIQKRDADNIAIAALDALISDSLAFEKEINATKIVKRKEARFPLTEEILRVMRRKHTAMTVDDIFNELKQESPAKTFRKNSIRQVLKRKTDEGILRKFGGNGFEIIR